MNFIHKDMNEINLIERYISRAGGRVTDVKYYNFINWFNAAGQFYIGQELNIPIQHTYFFGNIEIWTELYTITNLALKNAIRHIFETWIFTEAGATTNNDIIMGVNQRLSLMGNGDYSGWVRLYNCGFNRINLSELDFEVGATWATEIKCNGLLFTVI